MNIRRKYSLLISIVLSLTFFVGTLMGNVRNVIAETANTNASVTINGDGVSINAPDDATFLPIVLNGQEQTGDADFSPGKRLTINDKRGTLTGWTVQLAATKLSSGLTELPVGSLTMNKPPSITAGYTLLQGSNNTPSIGTTFSSPKKIDGEESAILIDASETAKAPRLWYFDWNTDKNFSIKIHPETAKVGTFTSVITWTLVTIP